MPRYDVPKAAPEPLRLVQRFVNTVDHEHGRELLGTPAGLAEWMREAGWQPPASVTGADAAGARELREAIRELLVANSEGATPSPAAVATVNRAARTGRLVIQVDETGQPLFVPERGGVRGALAQVVAVSLTAMLDGSWARLKACRNCRWAFYDYSRNRSAAWCSMSICGNRLKTRRYRERKSPPRRARAS